MRIMCPGSDMSTSGLLFQWDSTIKFQLSCWFSTKWISRELFFRVHLSSVTTIIRSYERGTVGTSIKCHHYHQGLWEGCSAVTSIKCHHYHQGLWEGGSVGTSIKCHHYHQGLWEEGYSRYIYQVSPLSSGPMRGGTVGTSIKCHHYHQDLWDGVQ
jgi:hypothetical protein